MSNIDRKIIQRLGELILKGEEVLNARSSYFSEDDGFYIDGSTVDFQLSAQWGTSVLNLIERVFGKDSVYYKNFFSIFPNVTEFGYVEKGLGVLKAAKEDYEGGYLFQTKVLIEAEVFGDFLEQAEHLLSAGYWQPAAVVAGAVLEDGLRKLCMRNNITLTVKPKLDGMNADLAKAGAYNVLTQKRVTALADIRNKAAHGQWTEFTSADVKDMLQSIRLFMEQHFS